MNSWKGNGEIPSIELTLSDSRLIGLIQLIESIPFPFNNSQDQRKEKKKKKSFSTTKDRYETIEKMSPTKKILYQNENDLQKDFEDKQFIQLQASFQINKVSFSSNIQFDLIQSFL